MLTRFLSFLPTAPDGQPQVVARKEGQKKYYRNAKITCVCHPNPIPVYGGLWALYGVD